MIVAIVASPEQFPGFSHQVRIILFLFRAHVERRLTVCRQIDLMMDRLTRRRYIYNPVVFAGTDRRIDQAIQRGRF